MGVSKVIYAGTTLIDLTNDNVTDESLLVGTKAHGADGEEIIGKCPFDADTSSATATEAEILSGKTAYVRGYKLTGKMTNVGQYSWDIYDLDQEGDGLGTVMIPQGYHDGSGFVRIDPIECSKIIPSNIRDGVEILGVSGTMKGDELVNAQAKTVTPTTAEQKVLPDTGYTHLTQVTVKPIPYSSTANTAGGLTVTIG
jgi:hypothetical protein